VFNALRKSGLLVTALAVVFAVSLASQAVAADTGTVSGKVVKDGAGVAGAKIAIVVPQGPGDKAPAAAPGADKGNKPKPVATATTESYGSFKIADVPAGNYMIRANLKGQGQARQKISVKAGENTEVNLALSAAKPGGGKNKKDKAAN
jgi:hypothetical protein